MGLAFVLAFGDSQPDWKDSNAEHVNFAQYYLDDLRFLSENSEGQKEVCNASVKVMLNGCRLEFGKVWESMWGAHGVHAGFFRKGNKWNLASTCKKLRRSVQPGVPNV